MSVSSLENEFLESVVRELEKAIEDLKNPIKEVIFNYPATIVYWKDGTKTVVKCSYEDIYDLTTGLALCFMKKMMGNKGRYNDIIKKYIYYK